MKESTSVVEMGLIGKLWNLAYLTRAPWDIGGPRPELVHLVEDGALESCRAIDLGCGIGENVIYLAKEGFVATGVDISSRAIAKAYRKARNAGVSPALITGDVTDLTGIKKKFDLIVDNGCLHSLFSSSRLSYNRSLMRLTQPGSRYFLRCFQMDPNRCYIFRESFLKGLGMMEPGEVERLFGSQFNIEPIQSIKPRTNVDAVYLMSKRAEN